jgi:hypothetical protein
MSWLDLRSPPATNRELLYRVVLVTMFSFGTLMLGLHYFAGDTWLHILWLWPFTAVMGGFFTYRRNRM